MVQKAVAPTPLIPPKRNPLPERGLGGNPATDNHPDPTEELPKTQFFGEIG